QHKLVVASAHRTPELVEEYLLEAEKANVKVIVAMAGMAAHLPGVIASKTLIPVIGVPISSKNTGGLDALYSIVQMPSGFPVATVAIDGAKNAGLLAIQIIANQRPELKKELSSYRNKMKEAVKKANKDI
ncbi:MAG TPA: 5-(carboxyamino)imidazole ribonucleotide mutase, partial [bacterium]|nr:5-(carboxyamino)imidazole ribonucleotide mutase [bacterium]